MLMHCTMEELLAIRDGQGSQGALRHLDECDECCDELELLHQRVAALKALPIVRPPRDRWSVVRDEVLAERARARRRFGGWLTAAAAASVALAIGLGGVVMPAAQGHRLELLDVRFEEARIRRLPRMRLVVLWQERIDLMDALVNVHARPVTLIGF